MTSHSARLDKLEKHILDLVHQSVSITKSNSDIEKSLNSMSDQITSIEDKINHIDQERAVISSQFSALEDRISKLDRQLIKSSVELRNVPKELTDTKQAMFQLVLKLSNSLHLNIQQEDVRDVTRLPSKRENPTTAIIIEFNNTLSKSIFLKKIKDYNKANPTNKFNSSHVGLADGKSPVYVSELLSPAEKKLFHASRKFAEKAKYDFCWTSEGRVFLRQNDKTQYIIVKNEEHLNQI